MFTGFWAAIGSDFFQSDPNINPGPILFTLLTLVLRGGQLGVFQYFGQVIQLGPGRTMDI